MGATTDISYRYVCDIARGGLGRVALAYREEGDFLRTYAIKRLLPAYESDSEMRSMFADEGRVAGLLRHPNVVSVIDVGEDDEGLYLVMDYIEGVPLSHLIKRLKQNDRVLPIQHCLRIIQQVCDGLHAAHELRDPDGTHLGLVHRDISPQNILIEPNGVVRVTDFGIAKGLGRKAKTSTGLIKGKAGYMAPECLQFEDPDRRADLFAVGVVLYELICGERLYGGRDMAKVARRILKEAPPDLALHRTDVPDELVALGFELLAKSPEARPESAKEVSKRVAGILRMVLNDDPAEDLEDFLGRHIDFAVIESRRELLDEARRSPTTDATPVPVSRVSVVPGSVARPRTRPRWVSVAMGTALIAAGVAAGIALTRYDGQEAVDASTDSVDETPLTNRASEPVPVRVEQAAEMEPVATAEQAETSEQAAENVDSQDDSVDDAASAEAETTPEARPSSRSSQMRRRGSTMRSTTMTTMSDNPLPTRWGWDDGPGMD